MTTKRVVLAEDDQGEPVSIGPVYSDESADRLRLTVDGYGWTVRGVVPLLSVAQFAAARANGHATAEEG